MKKLLPLMLSVLVGFAIGLSPISETKVFKIILTMMTGS